MFLILFDIMKVWRFSQKQNLNIVERQAFTSFKHGFFQVWLGLTFSSDLEEAMFETGESLSLNKI